MATIVLRAGLGRPLSFTEVDSNFNNLNTEKIERTGSVTFTGAQTFITGGASFPSIRFNSALTSGLFSPGTDQVGIATAGVSRMEFSAAGNVTINTPSSGNALSVGGNLAITGLARRIIADFNSVPGSDRTIFQTSTVNTGSTITVMPNGSGATGAYNALSSSDPSNTGFVQVRHDSGSQATLNSTKAGTGVTQPLRLQIDGVTSLELDTNRRVSIPAPVSGTALTIAAFSSTTAAINFSASGGVTTVGAAGGASALPATPVGYITVAVGGTDRKIPYYNI